MVYCIACSAKKIDVINGSSSLRSYLITGSYNGMDRDKFGNIYLINDENEISKYNADFELEFKNSFNRYGDISYIDATNPQKILLYYQDYHYVVFLDNSLSEIKTLNLEELGYWDISAVAMGPDNFLWIYDPVNFKLVKIDDSGQVRSSTNELYSDVFRNSNSKVRLYVDKNAIYLYNDGQINVYNVFGQEEKVILLEHFDIQFYDNFLIYSLDRTLYKHDLQLVKLTEEKEKILTLSDDFMDFDLGRNGCLVLDVGGVYKIDI